MQGRVGGENGERKEGRMAVISATRTRKRILATLLAPPRGPFRDPPPVTTHSFPFSSLYLRVYAFSTLVPLSLSRLLSPRQPCDASRARVYYLYNAWPGGAPALCSCTHKPLLRRERELRRRVTSTIRPRSRPRPCSAGQDRGHSLVRSLVRARGFFATIRLSGIGMR